MAEHYQRPGWFTTNVFDRIIAGATRAGVSVYGSRVLKVKGCTSGEGRQTPVNLRSSRWAFSPTGSPRTRQMPNCGRSRADHPVFRLSRP